MDVDVDIGPDWELDPEFYDDGWDKLPKLEQRGGLMGINVRTRDDWVVKISFKKQGDPKTGTGFYINIPDASHYVILTAGHNLIDSGGNPVTDLVVNTAPVGNPANRQTRTVDDRFISESYKLRPNPSNSINDYGALRIAKRNGDPPCGFGFALQLGHDDIADRELAVCGYYAGTKEGNPVTSTGQCLVAGAGNLQYKIKTEQGMSGSPVFMPYRGHDTVVGIHNYGTERTARGSRATRLNDGVLGEIFRWLGVVRLGRSLRAFPDASPAPPLRGLYLRFRPDHEFAWARLGPTGLETRFDILPGYAPAQPSGGNWLPDECRYVFQFRPPPRWPLEKSQARWVLWDVVRQGVRLVGDLQEFCLVRLVPRKKTNPDAFYVVLDAQAGGSGGSGDQGKDSLGDLVELRLEASQIKAQDIKLEALDTPEVSFGKHVRLKMEKFNVFCFE